MTQRLKGAPALPTRSPEFIEAVRKDYLGRKLTLREIEKKHGIADLELRAMMNLNKWPTRGKGAQIEGRAVERRIINNLVPRSKKRQFDVAVLAKDAREHQAIGDAERYGKHLQDVNFLRTRGVVIHVEANGLLRVGNAIKKPEDVKAMAERERRLMQPRAMP